MQPFDKYKALLPIVHRILLEQWDPIGVIESPEAQDEYDSYVPSVIALLINGSAEETIAAHLGRIATERMSLPSEPKREMRVARALLSAADVSFRN